MTCGSMVRRRGLRRYPANNAASWCLARRHITVPVFFILMLAAGCPSLTPAKELRTVSVQRTACYGPWNKELLGAHFLVVSMDGQLFLSDGEVVDTLSFQWENGKGPKDTDLVVPLPIEWILLPKEAKVFKE